MKKGLLVTFSDGLIIKEKYGDFPPLLFDQNPISLDFIRNTIKSSYSKETYLLVPIQYEILLYVREIYTEELECFIESNSGIVPNLYAEELSQMKETYINYRNITLYSENAGAYLIEIDSIRNQLKERPVIVGSVDGYSIRKGISSIVVYDQNDFSEHSISTEVVFSEDNLSKIRNYQLRERVIISKHLSFFSIEKNKEKILSRLNEESKSIKDFITKEITTKSYEIREAVKEAIKIVKNGSRTHVSIDITMAIPVDSYDKMRLFVKRFPPVFIGVQEKPNGEIEYLCQNVGQKTKNSRTMSVEEFEAVKEGTVFTHVKTGKYTNINFVKYYKNTQDFFSNEEETLIAQIVEAATSKFVNDFKITE